MASFLAFPRTLLSTISNFLQMKGALKSLCRPPSLLPKPEGMSLPRVLSLPHPSSEDAPNISKRHVHLGRSCAQNLPLPAEQGPNYWPASRTCHLPQPQHAHHPQFLQVPPTPLPFYLPSAAWLLALYREHPQH